MGQRLCDIDYSLDIIQRVFESDLVSDSSEKTPIALFDYEDFYVAPFQSHGCQYKYYTLQEHRRLIDSKCDELYDAASNTDNHAQRLDDVFSTLVKCEWRAREQTPEEIVHRAHQVLARMPSVPVELPDSLVSLPLAYFTGNKKSWKHLKVLSFPCKNLIRLVLYGASTVSRGWVAGTPQETLNGVAEVTDRATLKSTLSSSETERQRWFIVRCFLWSFWQRARTIFLYFNLRFHFKVRFEDTSNIHYWSRNFDVSPGLSMVKLSEMAAEEGKPDNMCSWAFRLLRTDSIALGLEFRLFHDRFSSIFGQEPARCRRGSDEPCDGAHYSHCLRFVGAHVEDQSAHDTSCNHMSNFETKVKWDEDSYRAVLGSRAVLIVDTETESGRLRYCAASERTLAISHVWSHGQGGRPGTGINSCLHSRYCRLARSFDCDSYWIDTTCIPEDHKLRKEAISCINSTFYQSRAVLVCDKDLMKVDVTDMSIQLKESLLVASLMCDWNIRAWTILEATKGREKIFLLCKDGKTVEFRRLVFDVYHHGNIALAVFATFLPHMCPWENEGKQLNSIEERFKEALPISVAGTWLSHRPASRPGDDVVIWSLLLGPGRDPSSNGLDFWKAHVGNSIPTGFLVSSAPRLTAPGLSWAPQSPFAAPNKLKNKQSNKISDFIRPSKGQDTAYGKITDDGLEGPWLVYRFQSRLKLLKKTLKAPPRQLSSRLSSSPLDQELDKIRHRFLPYHHYGALLRPLPSVSYSRFDSGGKFPDYTEQGTLIVVCSTKDEDWNSNKWLVSWKWRGVYKWPTDVDLPSFGKLNFWIA
ncbi:MAG: hypothetical protein Q9160_000188 [Pyrenula sp. 1 TL-2023]